MNDSEILTNVTTDELEALAAGVLVPASQARLDELVEGAKSSSLSANEEAELDEILHKIDQLNLLKARAKYTLQQDAGKASSK